ncbi:restriction endonuclease subunit S [Dyadobacter sp. 32]|uniref:restriction endonuclease subunit S n=1 Tax=Dyadobacter sp. 32 TaxID=538966 RepID=UPI0011ECD056
MINELPNGWVKTSLGKIAQLNMGQSPDGEFTNTNGDGLPLVGGAADFDNDKIKSSRFTSKPTKVSEEGDLILCIRATIGKVAFSDQSYCLGRGVAGLQSFVEPRWLYYKLQESAKKLDEAGTGSTFRQVDKKTLDEWPVDLPPAEEQKRIVSKIDTLFARSKSVNDNLNSIPKLIEKYKQGILGAAFDGNLTRAWRDLNNLSSAPVLKLQAVVLDFAYGTSSKSSPVGEIPVLRMGNIQDGKLNWDKLVYTSDPKEIKKYALSAGDVLFNRTNSAELVGKTALFDGEQEAIYAGYLIRIKCSEHLLPSYLTYCLNSPAGKAYCQRVKSDGINQSNINAKKLAAFQLPVPSIAEQIEIVRQIELAFEWINHLAYETSSANKLISHLNQAILSKGFTGELVKQNPKEVNAKALLENISRQMKAHVQPIRKKLPSVKQENKSMNRKLIDVLSDANDWISAQEAFKLCGVGKNATTEEIEPVYAELRSLDHQGYIEIETIRDTNGKKLFDQIKLNKKSDHAS